MRRRAIPRPISRETPAGYIAALPPFPDGLDEGQVQTRDDLLERAHTFGLTRAAVRGIVELRTVPDAKQYDAESCDGEPCGRFGMPNTK